MSTQSLTLGKVCLGTMTWGAQTPREDAWKQLDFAYEAGITLVDAGEMYPIPPTEDSQGLSERAAQPASRLSAGEAHPNK